ncbi:hypothetical protein, partial [Escherichia coli]|uniref:hypothetical protein n=1 Tax=Escherichia coli TaxID=562 RepID=UPI002010C5FB
VFDFLRKKEEEKPQEEVIATELEKVHVSEPEVKIEEEEEKKPSLLEKLHRSGSSSSSSSSDEEEVEEGGEKIKKKKKKGLKEKIEEKISGEKEEDTSIPIEKYDEVP